MVQEDEAVYDIASLLRNIDNSFHIGPQPVEGLIPLNPIRMPGHILSTAFSDNMRDGKDSLLRPINNIQVGLEYLASSQSDAHYNSRFGQVIHDTTIINVLAETCGVPGQIIAGDYANQAADEYVQQMIEDEANPLEDDAIARSFRLRLRGGPGSKGDSLPPGESQPLFNGIGLFKEELPKGSATNPFTSLPMCRRRNDRPLWTYRFFDVGRGGFIYRRCYYSIYVIRILNSYFRNNMITLCLLPVSYMFYCMSIIYFIRYIGSEVENYRTHEARNRYYFYISRIICVRFTSRVNRSNRGFRNGLF